MKVRLELRATPAAVLKDLRHLDTAGRGRRLRGADQLVVRAGLERGLVGGANARQQHGAHSKGSERHGLLLFRYS
jgi:hypothetical protein